MLYLISVPEVTASSVSNNDRVNFGPFLALDGVVVRTDSGLFVSEVQDYPWLQVDLHENVCIGKVTVVLTPNSIEYDNITVFVGNYDSNPRADNGSPILGNPPCDPNPHLVGNFTYEFDCKSNLVSGNIVVLQKMEVGTRMEINEVRIERCKYCLFCGSKLHKLY